MNSFSRRQLIAGALLAQRLRALPLGDIKLGVTTDEIDDDVQVAAAFLNRFGLHWAEVRNIWGKYNTAQPIEKVSEAQRILDSHGIRVSIEGTGFFKVPLPAGTPEGNRLLDEQWKLLDGAMDRARIFGVDKLRTFAFTFRKGETPTPKDYARIYELVTESARRAQKRGMRLAVENVGGSYVETGAQSAELLKHVKETNLGLTWDPNNAGAVGEHSYPDGYRKLDAARIFHVHLRDYRILPDGKGVWTAVGDGVFDNLGQIRSLLRDGFNGTYTLETHWHDPKGKAYSSETSLKALLKVIAAV